VTLNNFKTIVAILFIFLLCTSASANLSHSLDLKIKTSKEEKLIFDTIENQSGWPQIYDGGIEDCAQKIAIDSNDNIIVSGYSVYGSRSNADTIKYDSEGNELWHKSYNSGTNDVGWGLTVDDNDNVIVFGYSGILPVSEGNSFIVKYNSDGEEQWNKTINKEECDFPGDITTDNDCCIIITGGSGKWGSNVYYWTIFMNESGIEQWNHTFHEGPIDLGLGVAVDSQGDIIVTGFSATPFTDSVFIFKYHSSGEIIWEKRRPGNEPWDVAIDSKDNIIITGNNYEYPSIKFFTMKCDKDGNLLWINEFDSGAYDGANSVAIDSKDRIIVGGFSGFSQSNYFEHCCIIYDSDGKELCIKREGIKGYIYGVAVDSSDTIFVTGFILEGLNAYYTTRYVDVIPPDAQIKKPKEKYLHLFNVPLLPLPRNTISIGKLTVYLDIENLSDIEKVEFYLDNYLYETQSISPYEWILPQTSIGKHDIQLFVYDSTGSINRKQIELLKLI